MLEFQHVPIKLTGVDTKTDDKDSIPGTFVTAENVFMQKTGKVQNRAGYKFATNPVTHSSEVIATNALGDSNVALERDGSYYFDESAGASVVSSQNIYQTSEMEPFKSPFSITSSDLVGYGYGLDASNGLCTWSKSTGGGNYRLNYSLFRIGSETDIRNSLISVASNLNYVNAVTYINPIVVGSDYIVAVDGQNIKLVNVTSTTVAVSNVPSGLAGTISKMDASANGTYISVILYDTTNTISKLFIIRKSDKVTLSTNITTTPALLTVKCFIANPDIDYAIVATHNAAGANRTVLYNITYDFLGSSITSGILNTLGTSAAIYNILVDPAKVITSPAFLILDYGSYLSIWGAVSLGSGTLAELSVLNNHRIVSRLYNDLFITRCATNNIINNCYFLCNIRVDIIATVKNYVIHAFMYGLASNYASLFNYGSTPVYEEIFSTFEYVPIVRFQTSSALNATNKNYSLFFQHSKLNLTTNLPMIINWNKTAITNAFGNLRLLDNKGGRFPLWASYPLAGEELTVANSATAGSLVAGVYSYIMIYQTYDSNGNVSYSSPLFATSHTVPGGTTSVDLTWRFTDGFLDQTRNNVAIYRTELNGSIFYFLKNVTYTSGLTTTSTTNDGLADASLILNNVLYTTGDLIDSAPAPLVKSMSIAKSRLWIVSPENNDQVFYSKKIYPNEAPQFNSVYSLQVQATGGNLQAVAEMDDKVIIFRENAIYVTYGDGIDEIGNGSFADPQLLTMSLGCKYPRSIVLNDKGLFFMSYEGIYMVTRGLTVEYVGAPVENYNSLTITQALNLVDRHQIWFMSAEGTTLVHDDYFGTWHAFTNQATYAACILNDGTPVYYRTLAAAKYPGKLMIEDDTKYYDGASDNPIPITLETGWLSLTGIQGFQRMRTFTFVGTLNDTLILKLYNDFETSENESFTILPATVGTNPAQYQVKPTRQRTQGVKFKITLASLTGAFNISSMGIEAGVKKGTYRYDRSKRVSS